MEEVDVAEGEGEDLGHREEREAFN